MTSHKLIPLFIAMLLTTSLVAASGLTISGVYYDPIQAESGGEAIQLQYNGSNPLPLDSITVVTKSSSVPLPHLTLLPGQGFILADTGWSTLRDNLSWPLADMEFGLSLANTAGFVELLDTATNTTGDRLDWNSSNGSKAREGFLWTHQGETIPFFMNANSTVTDVTATVIILDGPPVIGNVSVTDDSSAPGIQLLSYNRIITIDATVDDPNGGQVNVTANVFGATYSLAFDNTTSDKYNAQILFQNMAPGDYPLLITASDGVNTVQQQLMITVLSSTSITTNGSLVFSGIPGSVVTGSFSIMNEGNIAKTVAVQNMIPQASCDTTAVVLQPDEVRDVTCTLTIPQGTPGNYTYTVRLLAS